MSWIESFMSSPSLFFIAPVLANFVILVLLFYKLTRIRVNLHKMAEYHVRIMGIHRDMDDTLRHIVKWNNIIARMVKVSLELIKDHETHVESVTQKADHVIDVVNKLSQRTEKDIASYKKLAVSLDKSVEDLNRSSED